jgi:hypothetical protein
MQCRESSHALLPVICVIATFMSCNGTPNSNEERVTAQSVTTKAKDSTDEQLRTSLEQEVPYYLSEEDRSRADEEFQAASRAAGQRARYAMSPAAAKRAAKKAEREMQLKAERPASWPDDVRLVDEPPIESFLPELSTVQSVTAFFADVDGNGIKIEIPASDWAALVALLSESQPIEFGSEILIIGYVVIATSDGASNRVAVMSYFADPVIFRIANANPNGPWLHFASKQSEPAVLEFFEVMQDASGRRKLAGW